MEYLKLFQNHSEYEAFASGDTMVRPNVSHCVSENHVHYNPFSWANEYLTFSILSAGTIVWKTQSSSASSGRTISYSINGGEWNEITSSSNGESFNVNVGDKVRFKGNNATYNPSPGNHHSSLFSASTASFNIEGNIMSLISGDSFVNATTIQSGGTFQALFAGTKVVNAKNLILPPITMKNYCYVDMFQGCTSLVNAPELPATALGYMCYGSMFEGCTSLTTAPELPAETLTDDCYSRMFYGCTSLTTAPELPATVLKNYCYGSMFQGCTSLVNAPVLPATTLASYCYHSMFSGCTSLNYIKAMFTTAPSGVSPNNYTTNWVSGVASSGTFVKNCHATWNTSGVSSIPNGWRVEYEDVDGTPCAPTADD